MLSDVNLRYLYALHEIPQHVFAKIMLARQFVPATARLSNINRVRNALHHRKVARQAMR
ncbi:hypothetical protein [Stieleria mannarensis]|uniref:hypothetical protein n=1 Tax=Stieleria mannarensis TaxID=2755585 RepID=UPI0016016C8E|nr:hypothetical protein [Rhodopirellula sp. JC639]